MLNNQIFNFIRSHTATLFKLPHWQWPFQNLLQNHLCTESYSKPLRIAFLSRKIKLEKGNIFEGHFSQKKKKSAPCKCPQPVLPACRYRRVEALQAGVEKCTSYLSGLGCSHEEMLRCMPYCSKAAHRVVFKRTGKMLLNISLQPTAHTRRS